MVHLSLPILILIIVLLGGGVWLIQRSAFPDLWKSIVSFLFYFIIIALVVMWMFRFLGGQGGGVNL